MTVFSTLLIVLQVSRRLVFFLRMPAPRHISLPVILNFHRKGMILALPVPGEKLAKPQSLKK